MNEVVNIKRARRMSLVYSYETISLLVILEAITYVFYNCNYAEMRPSPFNAAKEEWPVP